MCTVLLVEDETAVLEMLRLALQMAACQVLPARTGAEAIRVCNEHDGRLDVLVSDFQLPDLTARDLIPRITALRPNIRVLLISGYAEELVGATSALPVHAVLAKPFALSNLIRLVTEVPTHAKSPI